jgi:hypothetical protein
MSHLFIKSEVEWLIESYDRNGMVALAICQIDQGQE